MHRAATRLAHADRIARVADYIARHLDTPLDLERLAAVACFSPYHFHRVYRLTMGETPDQTVRRLRLHRAAVDLGRGDGDLLAVAKRAGYGSIAAFSRAFTQAYGQPPTAFRALRVPETRPPGRTENRTMHDVTVRDFEGVRLCGLPHRGDYNAIGSTFDRLVALAGPRGLIAADTRCFGIYYDDPETTPTAERRAFAGLTLPFGRDGGEGLEVVDLRPGPVAVYLHRGPYADLEAAYRYLYGTWLPGSGREPDDRPSFEEYLNDAKALPATEWLTAVCLPLAPAG